MVEDHPLTVLPCVVMITVYILYKKAPNAVQVPNRVAIRNGKSENENNASSASLIIFQVGYLELPVKRFSRSYVIPICLNPIQLIIPRKNR